MQRSISNRQGPGLGWLTRPAEPGGRLNLQPMKTLPEDRKGLGESERDPDAGVSAGLDGLFGGVASPGGPSAPAGDGAVGVNAAAGGTAADEGRRRGKGEETYGRRMAARGG